MFQTSMFLKAVEEVISTNCKNKKGCTILLTGADEADSIKTLSLNQQNGRYQETFVENGAECC